MSKAVFLDLDSPWGYINTFIVGPFVVLLMLLSSPLVFHAGVLSFIGYYIAMLLMYVFACVM